jgi:hypothetical protein
MRFDRPVPGGGEQGFAKPPLLVGLQQERGSHSD